MEGQRATTPSPDLFSTTTAGRACTGLVRDCCWCMCSSCFCALLAGKCPKALKTKPKKKRGRGSDPGCLLICVADNFFMPPFLQPLFFFFVSEARQCHTCAWGHGPCQEPHGATSLYSPQLLHLTSLTSRICSGRRGCCAAVAATAVAATAAALCHSNRCCCCSPLP